MGVTKYAGLYDTIVNVVTVGVTPTNLCEPNPSRLSLILSYAQPSGNCCVGPYPGITINDGINLGHTNLIQVKFHDTPSLVTLDWWGISPGGQLVTVIEEIELPR